MKKLLFALFLFTFGVMNAQTYVFQNFDNAVAGGAFWDMVNMYNNQGSATAKFDVTDVTDHKEGTGACQVDYLVGAGDGWGGYIVRTSKSPLDNYLNVSTGTALTFWYKVVTPVVKSQEGSVFMEFKMGDFDSEDKRDLWYREMPVDFADASGEWKQVTVDLDKFVDGGDKSKEWALQFGDGDRVAQLDKIKSFEFAIVYITGGAATNSPTAAGSVIFDGFAVTGNRYPSFEVFDNASSWTSVDDMNWAGAAGQGSVKLSDEPNDKVEGTAALKFEYTVNASQDWGGYVNFAKDITLPEKIEERTGLVLWVKNLVPHTAANTQRLTFRFDLIENNSGADETWVCVLPVDWSKASDWMRITLPLVQKPAVNSSQFPDQKMFPSDGFCQPWWSESGDKTFQPKSIKSLKVELSAEGDTGPTGGGARNEKISGTILLDIVQPSGYKIFDIVAPLAPQDVAGIPGVYSNLVTWKDLDGEPETTKYNVYYSKSAITDVTAKGVLPLKKNILKGTQVVEHSLVSPKTDKSVTWYYAVQAVDAAENIGAVGASAAVVNTAKGIPTIALKTVNFKADGDLSEWSGIKPFQLKLSNGTGFLVAGDVCDGDQDCSAEVYVALDKDYLYVAYDVTDDIVFDDNKYYPGDTWQADATELFIGMYNAEETPATVTYKRGATPDYHLRFNKQKLREDHWDVETDELLLPGDNYYWQEKFPSGYVIEAKIALADLATKRDANASKADVMDQIYLKEGYKINFDLGLFDNDGNAVNREGRIFWTATNGDQGYQDGTRWGITWLGDTDVVTTDLEDEMPAVYSLAQNYPNPFNPTTEFSYSIAKAGNVSLKIFDVLGRQVADLVNQNQEAGQYSVKFDASSLTSGVYLYRLESAGFVSTKKMVLMK